MSTTRQPTALESAEAIALKCKFTPMHAQFKTLIDEIHRAIVEHSNVELEQRRAVMAENARLHQSHKIAWEALEMIIANRQADGGSCEFSQNHKTGTELCHCSECIAIRALNRMGALLK